MKKGNILIVIPVLIAVAAIGIAGYFYLQNQQLQKASSGRNQESTAPIPSITPTLTQDETANWKTYTNVKFKFTLKYPQDYIFKGEGSNAPEDQIEAGEQISGTNPPAYNIATFEKSSQLNFSIIVFHKPSLTLDKNYTIGGECGSQFASKTLLNQMETVNSLQVLVRKQEFASPANGTTSIGIDYCFLSQDGYLITLRSGTDPTTFADTDKLLHQILSTFKFTDSTSSIPANWKTYSKNFSDQHFAWPVVEIKYPPDWTYGEKSLEGTADKLITFSNSGVPSMALQLSTRNFKDDYTHQSNYLGPLKSESVNCSNAGYRFQHKYSYIDAYYIPDYAQGQSGYVAIQLLNENSRGNWETVLSTFKFINPNQPSQSAIGYTGTIQSLPKQGSQNEPEYTFFNSNGFPVSDMSGQGQRVTKVPLSGITAKTQNQVKNDIGKTVTVFGAFQYVDEAPYLCADWIQD